MSIHKGMHQSNHSTFKQIGKLLLSNLTKLRSIIIANEVMKIKRLKLAAFSVYNALMVNYTRFIFLYHKSKYHRSLVTIL